jgi:hypothetical protein
LERLCGTKKVQKFHHIVTELHAAIQKLFEQKVVKFMHSCLHDNIKSSLHRYNQLGFVTIQTYASKTKGKAEFVVVDEKSRDTIQEMINYLASVRPLKPRQLKLIDETLLTAISRA